MTTDKAPTDAEAFALWLSTPVTGAISRTAGQFARAVLAKWGSPVVAGEPVQCTCAAKDMPAGTCCKVRIAFEKWYDEQNDGRLQPFDVFKGGWVSLHQMISVPQPTQAQAGAVPLTDNELVRRSRVGAIQTDDSGKVVLWPTSYRTQMEDRFKYGWREAEKHHGITHKEGGQHADR